MQGQTTTQLAKLLRSVKQGDLLSIGGVTIVGQGQTDVSTAADADVQDGQLWSVTVESDPGWYAVVSQDCDIIRDPKEEPCIVVCPVLWVDHERWVALRSGPYSPRHFPLPEDDELLTGDDGQRPVASLQYVTSVDKMALIADSVRQLSPLTGPQRQRFASWVGRRFARPAHDDLVERDVLTPCGSRIRALAKTFAKSGTNNKDSVKLVGAAEEWFVEATDKYVQFHAAVTESSLNKAGLWDSEANAPREDLLSQGCKQLLADLRKRLPTQGGYMVKVNVARLDGVSVAEFRAGWAPWILEGEDPLG